MGIAFCVFLALVAILACSLVNVVLELFEGGNYQLLFLELGYVVRCIHSIVWFELLDLHVWVVLVDHVWIVDHVVVLDRVSMSSWSLLLECGL